MKRILIYGTDDKYYDFTMYSIRNFLKHNTGWQIIIMDVGLLPEQVQQISQVAEVVKYERMTMGNYPTGYARVKQLYDYPDDDTLTLYLDCDTIVYSSIEPLIQNFLESKHFIGVAPEPLDWYDPSFPFPYPYDEPMSICFKNHFWDTPQKLFKNFDKWRYYPILNTGVFLGYGNECKKFGKRALELYSKVCNYCVWGEQSVIASLIYEHNIPYYVIPKEYNFINDKALDTSEKIPTFDGTPIVIRHFCCEYKKKLKAIIEKEKGEIAVEQCNCRKCLYQRELAKRIAKKGDGLWEKKVNKYNLRVCGSARK